ncbi:hypothetical protein EWM64_g7994 [Hericium alpestre]|uniref:DUF659 domain-containing protein n=1 Tax=Hericium alpestre TaxID=135208 RepID=A0A4Y9ZRB0_9AGAM|nr:hypothetical protein EWM64_g7994 [Hericium alpestre]
MSGLNTRKKNGDRAMAPLNQPSVFGIASEAGRMAVQKRWELSILNLLTTFSDIHVPMESARVLQLSQLKLKKTNNLTISFDGGTTRNMESIYMVHVTTPSPREVHLMEDSTGNTRLTRELLAKEIPTIIILADPCHQLNLLAKDITKLDFFAPCLLQMKKVIQFFKKSSFGSRHLRTARFKLCLTQMTAILMPVAKAMKCLEAVKSTASDVYLYWLAVMATFRDLFSSHEDNPLSLPCNLVGKVRCLVNARYQEMIEVQSNLTQLTLYIKAANDNISPFEYWNNLSHHNDSKLLAYLAIKIYSICLNSMGKERTVSNFSKLNQADCALLKAMTIVGMTRIKQNNWHVKGYFTMSMASLKHISNAHSQSSAAGNMEASPLDIDGPTESELTPIINNGDNTLATDDVDPLDLLLQGLEEHEATAFTG